LNAYKDSPCHTRGNESGIGILTPCGITGLIVVHQLKWLSLGVGPETGKASAVIGPHLIDETLMEDKEGAGMRLEGHHFPLRVKVPPLRLNALWNVRE
jgi:hypothetical protein